MVVLLWEHVRPMVKNRTTGEFDVKMGWKPTLRHSFGLSKLSSSLLSRVCGPLNNAFLNYCISVLFSGAHVHSVPMERELSLLTKTLEDVEPGWLEGWLSLPLLPPSTSGWACRGLHRLLFSIRLHAWQYPIQGRISHPQEATQKNWCSHLLSFSNQVLYFKSGSC